MVIGRPAFDGVRVKIPETPSESFRRFRRRVLCKFTLLLIFGFGLHRLVVLADLQSMNLPERLLAKAVPPLVASFISIQTGGDIESRVGKLYGLFAANNGKLTVYSRGAYDPMEMAIEDLTYHEQSIIDSFGKLRR